MALGLLVALTYGSGDFFGGLAAKRTGAATVVVGSFAVSASLLAVVTIGWAVVGGLPSPAGHDVILGVATGCVGPIALGFLYQGLATGRMSVVAPITAVVAAVVPFSWGLAHGERPSATALLGVTVALVAVGLIAGAPPATASAAGEPVAPPRSSRDAVPGAMVSGLGFGVIFVLLGSTTEHAGLWPLLVARLVAVALTVAVLAALGLRRQAGGGGVRTRVLPAAGSWRLVAASGVLDISANATYLAATHRGLLSIVAVLSSLYPASTVVLARLLLGERFHRLQLAGLALAALGVTAMAVT